MIIEMYKLRLSFRMFYTPHYKFPYIHVLPGNPIVYIKQNRGFVKRLDGKNFTKFFQFPGVFAREWISIHS